MFTIDASVYVNSLKPYEANSSVSQAFLELIHNRGATIIEPTLMRVEVAAALARILPDPRLAVSMADAISALPGQVWRALDETLAEQSATLAAERRLRGADAVYAALALREGLTLVTLDRQQLERLSGVVATLTPADAISALMEDSGRSTPHA